MHTDILEWNEAPGFPTTRSSVIIVSQTVKTEFRSWGAHPPRVWLTAPRGQPFARGTATNARNFLVRTGFSARAQKTAPEAGALPIQFRSFGVKPKPNNGIASREHSGEPPEWTAGPAVVPFPNAAPSSPDRLHRGDDETNQPSSGNIAKPARGRSDSPRRA